MANSVINQIAGIFQNNLGNRLSLELANGMIQEIAKLIPQTEASNDNPTTTDSSTAE